MKGETLDRWRARLRSVRGQLWLLAVVFGLATILAVVPYFLRGWVFEPHAREAYPAVDGYAATALPVLKRAGAKEDDLDPVFVELKKRLPRAPMHTPEHLNLERLYGAWMEDEDSRAGGLLARRLTNTDRGWLREWTLSRCGRHS